MACWTVKVNDRYLEMLKGNIEYDSNYIKGLSTYERQATLDEYVKNHSDLHYKNDSDCCEWIPFELYRCKDVD